MDKGLLQYAKALREEAYKLYVPKASWLTSTDHKRYQREVMNYITSELIWCYPCGVHCDMAEVREIVSTLFDVSSSTVTRILKPKKYYKTGNSEACYWQSHLFDNLTSHIVRDAEWYKQQEGIETLLSMRQVEINGEVYKWKAERFSNKAPFFGKRVTIIADGGRENLFKIAQDGGLNFWNKYELMGEYYE